MRRWLDEPIKRSQVNPVGRGLPGLDDFSDLLRLGGLAYRVETNGGVVRGVMNDNAHGNLAYGINEKVPHE